VEVDDVSVAKAEINIPAYPVTVALMSREDGSKLDRPVFVVAIGVSEAILATVLWRGTDDLIRLARSGRSWIDHRVGWLQQQRGPPHPRQSTVSASSTDL